MVCKLLLKWNRRCFFNQTNRYKSSSVVIIEKINCFGSLIVQNTRAPTVIQSIDPHDVPNGDKAFIKVSTDDEEIDIHEYFNINYDTKNCEINVMEKTSEINKDLFSLDIKVPHHYNMVVQSKSINILETEGDTLQLSSSGDCNLGKIKSFKTQIDCAGTLHCKNFYGNGLLQAKTGVNIRKIQSNNVSIESDGNINLAAVYSLKTNCESSDGSIEIGSIHGKSSIKTHSGMVSISSSVGDLTIATHSGNIDVVIDQTDDTNIASTYGDVNIGLTDSVSAFIEASSKSIDIPEDLLFDGLKQEKSDGNTHFEGKVGNGQSSINVTSTHGNISFARESLFSKFKLQD